MISSLKIEDGPYKGNPYEEIMFKDYLWICKELEKEKKKRGEGVIKTGKEIKMEQLIEKGENRKSRRECPHCNKNHICYFSIIVMDYGKTKKLGGFCCENGECVNKTIEQGEAMSFPKKPLIKIHTIRFSSMATIASRFNGDEFMKTISGYFHYLYKMPEKILCQQRDYIMFFQD